MRTQCLRVLPLFLLALMTAPTLAQNNPWVRFSDNQSTSICDVINADNAQLVVLQGTGQLRIVSGTDVTLADAIVDADGFVTFEGEAEGLIGFAIDGDGFRSLWWTSLVGEVAHINGRTGAPTFSAKSPEDYHDASCDACDLWDDPAACPPPTVSLCGANVPLATALTAMGLVGTRIRRIRRSA